LICSVGLQILSDVSSDCIAMSFKTLPGNKANYRQLKSSIEPIVSGLLATYLHNSMEQNVSSEDNSPSAGQQDIQSCLATKALLS
jgi:hypothetical protein